MTDTPTDLTKYLKEKNIYLEPKSYEQTLELKAGENVNA